MVWPDDKMFFHPIYVFIDNFTLTENAEDEDIKIKHSTDLLALHFPYCNIQSL